jgi:hypothetical protein
MIVQTVFSAVFIPRGGCGPKMSSLASGRSDGGSGGGGGGGPLVEESL